MLGFEPSRLFVPSVGRFVKSPLMIVGFLLLRKLSRLPPLLLSVVSSCRALVDPDPLFLVIVP
jgi:hypothetical protein